MSKSSDDVWKVLIDKGWPVVTAAIGTIISMYFTYSKLQSPWVVAIHPVAMKLTVKDPDQIKSELGKRDRVCKVDHQLLEEYLDKLSSRDVPISEYIKIVREGQNEYQSRALYREALAQEDFQTPSFEELEKTEIVYDCVDRHGLSKTLGLEAAVVLSEQNQYLMSRYCSLYLGKRNSNEEVDLRVVAAVEPSKDGSLAKTQTILLQPPTTTVSFNLYRPTFGKNLSNDVIDKYNKVVNILSEYGEREMPLPASISCRVFFHDKVKQVGGSHNFGTDIVFTGHAEF